jgi:hypothetical protein
VIAEIVYILCALTSFLCAFLLFRQYRSSRSHLLFWSTCCFVCLAGANTLLFVDIVVLPDIDLALWRSSITLAALLMLLYGLIRERT